MKLLYILLGLVMLGIMILIHESGHFFASRLMKIPVKEFSIGFGHKLLQWKSKKYDTVFSLRLFIAGGYCMYYGEDDPEAGKKFSKDDPRLLSNQNVWKRMFSVLMGPVMNIVFAFIVCAVFILCIGSVADYNFDKSDLVYAQIQSVVPDGAAGEAGVMPGDILLRVNGRNAYGLIDNDFQNAVVSSVIREEIDGNPGESIVLSVRRDGAETDISVLPKFDAQSGRAMLGIEYAIDLSPMIEATDIDSFPVLMSESWKYMVEIGGSIIKGIGTLFSSWKNLTTQGSGPVGIVSTIASETQEYGFTAYVQLLIIISVNLGIINLIPIPGLDGSRVVFLLIEAIRRKPVPQKIEAYIHLGGFALLFGLIILLTYFDVLRIVGCS